MRKIYFIAFAFVAILLSGCSKDFLKSYDRRIIGTWNLVDVDRRGIGGEANRAILAFTGGSFTFETSGKLNYTDNNGKLYTGSWNITRRTTQSCSDCGTDTDRELSVSLINFDTQELVQEIFDDMRFTGTNRFRARVKFPFNSFVFFFHRQ